MTWLYVVLFSAGIAVGLVVEKIWQVINTKVDGTLHVIHFERESQIDVLVEFENPPSKLKSDDRVIFDVRVSRR